MKVKILNNLSYQAFPEVDGMIDIDDELLKQIGITKQFDKNENVVDYFNKDLRVKEIKSRLEELTKDFIQEMLGAIIPNIEEKRLEFIELHNELRELQGKEPRVYS